VLRCDIVTRRLVLRFQPQGLHCAQQIVAFSQGRWGAEDRSISLTVAKGIARPRWPAASHYLECQARSLLRGTSGVRTHSEVWTCCHRQPADWWKDCPV